MHKALSGVLSLMVASALGASCSGAEFTGGVGSAGTGSMVDGGTSSGGEGGTRNHTGGKKADAGAPVTGGGSPGAGAGAEGGAGAGGAGGATDLPPECSPDDAARCDGNFAVKTCSGGEWKSEDCKPGPQDCAPATCTRGACVSSSLTPADTKGDCQRTACAKGSATTEVDLADLPTPRGTCDVASCTEAGPKLTDDNSKCPLNKRCSEGACSCRNCPNGKLPNVVADACLMPTTVTATADHTTMESPATGAIDGNINKTWNAGGQNGTLTLTLSAPQTMTAVVLYVTGQSNGAAGSKLMEVTATIEVEGMAGSLVKTGTYDYGAMATGFIRLELGGPLKVTKMLLKFKSDTTWIAVNEAMFVLCT